MTREVLTLDWSGATNIVMHNARATLHLVWNPTRGCPAPLFVEALLGLATAPGQVRGLDKTLPEFMAARRGGGL